MCPKRKYFHKKDLGLRYGELLSIPKARLRETKRHGIYSKIMMYDKLPINITSLYNLELKRKIKPFLMTQAFYTLQGNL